MSSFPARLKRLNTYDYMIVILRVALGLLFIYASLDKIWHPGLFAKAIANYRILPIPFLHVAAILLPWLELVVGMLLSFNYYPRAANLLIGFLTLVFTVAILSAIYRGLDFNCGCFSVRSGEVNLGALKVFQNFGLILAAGILENHYRKRVKN